MKTFSSTPGGAAQGAVPSTPSSNNAPSSAKSIDLNSVYMFFEELKVAFEKGQAKQSDGSQVQTEVYNAKFFEDIISNALKKIQLRVVAPEPDFSSLPKPKDYTQNFTELGSKVEKNDSETAKQLGKVETSLSKLEAAVAANTKAINAEPKVQRIEKTLILDPRSWKMLLCVIISFLISISLGVWLMFKCNEVERYEDTDLKYRVIQMNGSISGAGLDSLEVWFQDPERVKDYRQMVTDYEQRMEKLRRSTLERDRLNNEIDNLNSQNPKNSR